MTSNNRALPKVQRYNDTDRWEVPGVEIPGHVKTRELANLDCAFILFSLIEKFGKLGPSSPPPPLYYLRLLNNSYSVGNIAVCLVIVKNKSMHTATNYYLFSLAISDLMILVLGKRLKWTKCDSRRNKVQNQRKGGPCKSLPIDWCFLRSQNEIPTFLN